MKDAQKLTYLLDKINIKISESQTDTLINYLYLIQKWNKSFNLTAISDFDEMLRLHLVDSASISHSLHGNNILDVGTGAGLPGLVLAILNPKKQFTLLDSNNKKIRFLRQCQLELSLLNIMPIHARVETFQPVQLFDSIICRAFSSLDNFVSKSQQHLAKNGQLLAMKAKWNGNENNSVFLTKHAVQQLSTNNTERHLIQILQKDL